MTSCSLPSASSAEIAAADAPDMQQADVRMLDLSGCNVFYVGAPMLPGEEVGVSHRYETWPPAIRNRLEMMIEDWLARNPHASVKGITMGVCEGNCSLTLHWMPRP